MRAINIIWDLDGKIDALLPSEIDIPDSIRDEEGISDYLSDITGSCHKGFCLTD